MRAFFFFGLLSSPVFFSGNSPAGAIINATELPILKSILDGLGEIRFFFLVPFRFDPPARTGCTALPSCPLRNLDSSYNCSTIVTPLVPLACTSLGQVYHLCVCLKNAAKFFSVTSTTHTAISPMRRWRASKRSAKADGRHLNSSLSSAGSLSSTIGQLSALRILCVRHSIVRVVWCIALAELTASIDVGARTHSRILGGNRLTSSIPTQIGQLPLLMQL